MKGWVAFSCVTSVLVLLATHLSAGPLHDAVRAGDVRAVKQLVVSADLEESDFILGTPLHLAVNVGDTELMSLLIAAGSDIEAPSELLGMRPIHLAVNTGDAGILRFLTGAGADVNSTTLEGETALHVAVRLGKVELVEVLIENSVSVDQQEPTEGFTPLHMATLKGEAGIVRRLIDAGADPEAKSHTGRTPFMFATSLESVGNVGDFSLIRYLAGLGVDLNVADSAGYTALSQAAGRGGIYVEMADILRELGATE